MKPLEQHGARRKTGKRGEKTEGCNTCTHHQAVTHLFIAFYPMPSSCSWPSLWDDLGLRLQRFFQSLRHICHLDGQNQCEMQEHKLWHLKGIHQMCRLTQPLPCQNETTKWKKEWWKHWRKERKIETPLNQKTNSLGHWVLLQKQKPSHAQPPSPLPHFPHNSVWVNWYKVTQPIISTNLQLIISTNLRIQLIPQKLNVPVFSIGVSLSRDPIATVFSPLSTSPTAWHGLWFVCLAKTEIVVVCHWQVSWGWSKVETLKLQVFFGHCQEQWFFGHNFSVIHIDLLASKPVFSSPSWCANSTSSFIAIFLL